MKMNIITLVLIGLISINPLCAKHDYFAFVSKVLWRAVAKQLQNYLTVNILH